MVKNWKTTLAGISAVLTSVAGLLHDISVGNYANIYVEVTGIVAGIGLIWAKDSNVTGGTVKQ